MFKIICYAVAEGSIFIIDIQKGHPVFNDVGIIAGIHETDWSWAPLVADFDNDGFRDLIITNGLPRDVTDLDYIAYDNGQGPGATNTSLKMVDALPIVKVPNYAFKNTGGFVFAKHCKKFDQKFI